MTQIESVELPERSPFSLVDYVQIAQMARRSAVLLIEQGNLHGELVVRDGEAWASRDDLGEGEPALRRLLLAGAVEGTANVRVVPLPTHPIARNVEVSLQAVLLDLARERDEAEAPPMRARPRADSSPHAEAHFDAFYELGIEAMLRRDYAEAFEALSAARDLRPEHRIVRLNLERLQALGFSDDALEAPAQRGISDTSLD